mgnify:CR=1 FL=1
MSRIGKQPIKIPEGVMVEIADRRVKISGPKGDLVVDVPPEILVKELDGEIRVERKMESPTARERHGTVRALLANASEGVTKGFEKRLVLEGLGYRVRLEGKTLILEVGFSYPVRYEVPEGIDLKVEGREEVIIEGPSKQLVGKVASEIRSICPPEPYKGKGIRYKGEVVRRKPGKAAKAGEGFGED